MEVEVVSITGKPIVKLESLSLASTVKEVKSKIYDQKKGPYPPRQMLRLEPKGKGIKDEDTLALAGFKKGDKLYLKDLGPQMPWETVFLCEYGGPLFVYFFFYLRPSIIYGSDASAKPYAWVVHLAAASYIFHFAKRILETLFVHHFSHETMPLLNLFKNSGYYWGFAGYIAYHVNHPLYTAPCDTQVYIAAALFFLFELGNYSIHTLLRDLRPAGTKVRKIPYPNSNPLTLLFNYVSCPNYTYEFYAWSAFAIMTQCFPVVIFTFAGLVQMTIWALAKHRNYKKEFSNYPKGRKSILPFLI